MIAKLAYLTTPAPGVFVLNLQDDAGDYRRYEICKAHLINILIEGAAMAFREQYSAAYPLASHTEGTHDDHRGQFATEGNR